MIPMEKWRWEGLAGHFIDSGNCAFRLCTIVGKFRVSTVGAYYPSLRQADGKMRPNKEMREIGLNRHYETFVFKLNCHGEVDDWGEIDSAGVEKSPRETPFESDIRAEDMHLKMCLKWAAKKENAHSTVSHK